MLVCLRDHALTIQAVRLLMLYLATQSPDRIHWAMRSGLLGALTSPAQPEEFVQYEWMQWAAVCNRPLDFDRYDQWLDEFSQSARNRCLFITVPSDTNWDTWSNGLAAHGLPLGFVVDNSTDISKIPWGEFEVLFIGGSLRWKFSRAVVDLSCIAHRNDTAIHVSRVATETRMGWCAGIGASSVDGPCERLPDVLRWMKKANADRPRQRWVMASWLAKSSAPQRFAIRAP